MNVELNDKYKKHINELYDCDKFQALDYAFTQYYVYEQIDNELADFFFSIIGRIILGIYNGPIIEMTNIKANSYEKKLIVEAAYQYTYDDSPSLIRPLKTIFSELLNKDIDEPFIVPYMQLIKIMQHKKEKSSKIAN